MTDNITLPRAVVEMVRDSLDYARRFNGASVSAEIASLDAALAEPKKERAEVAAPARSGVGAGQTNAPTGEAYRTPEPDAKREPATDEQVAELCKAKGLTGKWSCLDYHYGWRDAERFHGIRKEDK
jgi:hypothetical protein